MTGRGKKTTNEKRGKNRKILRPHGCDMEGRTKLSSVLQRELCNFVLVQKDRNTKKEIYDWKGP